MSASAKLAYTFLLIDKMSGPLDRINKKLQGVETGLGKAGKGAKGASDSLFTLKNAAAGLIVFDKVSGWIGDFTGMIFGAVKGMAGLTYEFGKFALESASFKENSLVALEATLGSADKAKKMFKDAVALAAKTPFETKDIIEIGLNLRSKGFSDEIDALGRSQVSVLTGVVGDMAALQGMDVVVLKNLSKALGDVRGNGKLAGQELLQLANAGIGKFEIFSQIAKQTGKTLEEVSARQASGGIGSAEALDAIVAAAKGKSFGKIGELQNRMSKTMSGMWSNIKSRPFEMFLDLDQGEGLGKVKGFMSNLDKALNPSSPQGSRIKKRVEKLADGIFGFTFGSLSGDEGADKIADFLERGIDLFEAGFNGIKTVFIKIGEEATSYLKDLGGGDVGKGFKEFVTMVATGIGEAAKGLAGLVPVMTKVFELILEAAKATGLLKEESTVKDITDEEVLKKGQELGIDAGRSRGEYNKVVDVILAERKVQFAEGLDENPLYKDALKAQQDEKDKAAGEKLNMGLDRVIEKAGLEAGLFEVGYKEAHETGGQVVAGYNDGIKSGFKLLQDTSGEMGTIPLIETLKGMQIKSPSKVMEALGYHVGEGYGKGLSRAKSLVYDAANDNLVAPTLEASSLVPEMSASGLASSFSSAALSSPSVSITVNVDGAGKDASEIASEVAEVTAEKVLKVFRQLAIELGREAA